MKIVVGILLVVVVCCCSVLLQATSVQEKLDAIQALQAQLEEERSMLLASMNEMQPEVQSEEFSTGITLLQPALDRCINADGTVVFSDAGAATSERLNNNTPVKLWAKSDNSRFKIGNNRWVSGTNLKMKCEPGISLDQLRRIMPTLPVATATNYLSPLNAAMTYGSITTCARRAAFLAQLAHESAGLYYMEEIASGADYEGRTDLGNTQPGDGRRYKGRGPIQLNGRANYRSAGRALGVDLEGNPTLAATPQWGFKVATWYWTTRNLNSFADQNTQSAFDSITYRINGGYNGKADRDNYWRRARSMLGC